MEYKVVQLHENESHKFESKTILIFQLWQLGDSEDPEIFEIIEYHCYFGASISQQYLFLQSYF